MNRRRETLVRLAAAGAFGSAGISGLIRAALAAGNQPVAPGLHRLKGKVTINGAGASEGQLVRPGDTIVTARDAEATYVVGQNAFLQRENTQVAFGADLAKDFFRVVAGRILSVFDKGDKTLRTATATIGIRGTACYIEAEAARVYFCLCYGKAEVVSAADPTRRELIETTYHDHPVYITGDQRMPMTVNAPVINHNDAELTMLENLCGRWPPFTGKSGGKY